MRPYNFSLEAPIEPRGGRGTYASQVFADPALDPSLARPRTRQPSRTQAQPFGAVHTDFGAPLVVLHTQMMTELSRLSARLTTSGQITTQRLDVLEGSLRHSIGIGVDTLRERLDSLRQELQGETRTVCASLSDRLDAVENSLDEVSKQLARLCSLLDGNNTVLEKGGHAIVDPQLLVPQAPTPAGTMLLDQTSLARLDESVVAADRRGQDAGASMQSQHG